MILKALLAAMGLSNLPGLHNEAVHDALNARTAFRAGHARSVRLSALADQAEARGDREGVRDAMEKQSEVRAALDDLSRRLG
jgi:hypothetical protein